MFMKPLIALACLCLALPAWAADTLADMGIEISPELYAAGIRVGEPHGTVYQPWQPARAPQFVREESFGPIVILGDSIMAALGSWPGTMNLAVSGTTTAEILSSVSKIPPGARIVFVEGGFNNFAVGAQSQIVPDYQQIIAKAPGTQIKVIGILPVNDAEIAPMRNANNATIAATDTQIAKLCTGRCSVVPSPFGASLPANLNIGDGIHPNAAGQAVLAKAVR